MAPVANAVEVDGLIKRYRGSTAPALAGVSFAAGEGEILGLLGPNGAGKTTTVAVLTGILRPSGGRVRVLGSEGPGRGERRRRIGVVPQEVALYPSLTAQENLTFFGRVFGLRGGALAARVAECIDLFGLAEARDRRIRACSGGIRRRVNLAAGILHRPRLLFLDEPTVGIDVQSRRMILEHLRRMNREEGTAMVYTSHQIEEAEALCDRVVIIDHGRVVATGRPADLAGPGREEASLADVFVRLTGEAPRD